MSKHEFTNKKAYNIIVPLLKKHGIILHRYFAKSGSIYIKLDYGALWSIRIADHDGRKHLQYKFNVITCPGTRTLSTNIRYWYNARKINVMIDQILLMREKMIKNGTYKQRLEKYKNNKNSYFWRHAIKVEE